MAALQALKVGAGDTAVQGDMLLPANAAMCGGQLDGLVSGFDERTMG